MHDGSSAMTTPQQPTNVQAIEAKLRRKVRGNTRRDYAEALILPILALIAGLLVWEAGTRFFQVPQFLLPAPSVILQSAITHQATLLKNSGVTSLEILLGFGLSVAIGVPLALLMFAFPVMDRVISPILISSQAVPKIAVAPLFIVWFGFGLLPKVLMTFLVAFFPVVINTAMGLAAIQPETIYLARSMGLGPVSTFFKIRLPAALPSIFAGLKISITLAVVGAVVGEFVGGESGLGYLLIVANGSMDTPLIFAGIGALTILGIIAFAIIGLLERAFLGSHVKRSAGRDAT